VVPVVLLAIAASLLLAPDGDRPAPVRPAAERPPPRAAPAAAPHPDPPLVGHAPPVRDRPVRWRRSLAVGVPGAGRLVRGVRLPAEGSSFYTWDPVLRRSPNRAWRRWGTDRLLRVVLRVARGFHAAHPARRLAIGDLSRPRGGNFGPQFGYIGHATHQNGLDVDVYYPRADRRELAPRGAADIDRRLSQELVDRFLAAGATVIFVGPSTGLTGPADRVQPLVNHDNHLHVRIP
jgi:hypothetical protein